ncbi:hypothetical protein QF037_006479 [Streptomyces canus]|uniref:hypothetical protein n=1 Tax=Streptomyces canus TaxID=58343 RepID=UPI002781A43C|nr:hypothetical protein [Streptomyces canus]MDQ0602134.1 hypothetical protein [Streptomyces canus]
MDMKAGAGQDNLELAYEGVPGSGLGSAQRKKSQEHIHTIVRTPNGGTTVWTC